MDKNNLGLIRLLKNFFLYKKIFFMYEMQFKINKPPERG
jgi:hypothetical protein